MTTFMADCEVLAEATLESGGNYGDVVKAIRSEFQIGSLVEGARSAKAALANLAARGNGDAKAMLDRVL